MRGGTERDVLSSRLDLRDLEEILELRDRPVGHPDRLRLALVVHLSDRYKVEESVDTREERARARRGATHVFEKRVHLSVDVLVKVNVSSPIGPASSHTGGQQAFKAEACVPRGDGRRT